MQEISVKKNTDQTQKTPDGEGEGGTHMTPLRYRRRAAHDGQSAFRRLQKWQEDKFVLLRLAGERAVDRICIPFLTPPREKQS
jgi:hypothetical protein